MMGAGLKCRYFDVDIEIRNNSNQSLGNISDTHVWLIYSLGKYLKPFHFVHLYKVHS